MGFSADPAGGISLDTRTLTIAAVVALGMTMLIPTFNAINNSYIEVTEVPDWMPPPDKFPENFRPPENFKPPTPPPDWTPPPDYEPPPGWENWQPPPDWEGKFEGYPPPPGSCPPPVYRWPEGGNATWTIGSESSHATTFTIPKYTLGIGVWMNATDWQAQTLRGSIQTPGNMGGWGEEMTANGNTGTLGVNPQTTGRTTFNWTWDPRAHNDQLPTEGDYTVVGEVTYSNQPFANPQGTWKVETLLVIACGGAFA